MLGCRSSLEAYVKNVREKAIRYSLKATEVLLDADGRAHPSVIFIKVR